MLNLMRVWLATGRDSLWDVLAGTSWEFLRSLQLIRSFVE